MSYSIRCHNQACILRYWIPHLTTTHNPGTYCKPGDIDTFIDNTDFSNKFSDFPVQIGYAARTKWIADEGRLIPLVQPDWPLSSYGNSKHFGSHKDVVGCQTDFFNEKTKMGANNIYVNGLRWQGNEFQDDQKGGAIDWDSSN